MGNQGDGESEGHVIATGVADVDEISNGWRQAAKISSSPDTFTVPSPSRLCRNEKILWAILPVDRDSSADTARAFIDGRGVDTLHIVVDPGRRLKPSCGSIIERTFIDSRGVDALHINLFTVVPLQRMNLGLMNGFSHNPKSLYGRAFAKKESRSYPREWIQPQSYTKG